MSKNTDVKRRFFHLFSFIFLLLPLAVYGGVIFSDLDLSFDNQLLFRAGSGSGAVTVQDALFIARLPPPAHERTPTAGVPASTIQPNMYTLQQLTAYPEKIDLLENGRTLQIRNAFGAMRIPVSGGLPLPIPGLPSFVKGNPVEGGRAEEMAPSADGRWLLYLDPVSAALGNLVMVDVLTGAKTNVASLLERPEKDFPASWSPDSRFFVYERAGKLYYYMNGSLPVHGDERTRFIGDGTVNSITWGRHGDFYYLRDSSVFRVRFTELSTRTLYSGFLEMGTIAGKIPFDFDPSFDNFWIAPDGRSLLVSKGRRSLFYFPLDLNDHSALFDTTYPYLMIPRSCSALNVLWSAEGTVTVLVSIPDHAGTEVRVWRLKLSGGRGGAVFEPLLPPYSGVRPGSFPNGTLSPDGRLALLWGAGGVLLYDYAEWKLRDILTLSPGLASIWAGNEELVIGDEQKIEKIWLGSLDDYRISKRETLCLSRAGQAAFEENTLRILAKNGDTWYVTDGKTSWTATSSPRVKASSQSSAHYRVYLERQMSGLYSNLPMLRNISSVGTFTLFPPVSGGAAGNREIALCFDLYDDDQGLPEVLDALNRFGIRATFFLNGEFIRRHPQAVVDIITAGHEAASMFFALLDLSDARYQAGPDFISRGLARNEDEFFQVTGRELALLWHPPWYTVSAEITAAAAKAGYVTSGRDVDPHDWVSREEEKRLGIRQNSPSEMVDRIMGTVKSGSIIPVRLGLLPGGRSDYLFNRINVLLDALIRERYTLTTVSTLIEHSR